LAKSECATCVWEKATGRSVDTSKSKMAWGDEIGVSEASIRRHLKHSPAAAVKTPENGAQSVSGDVSGPFELPESLAGLAKAASFRDPETGSWYKVSWDSSEPAWPLIEKAAPVEVVLSGDRHEAARDSGYNLAIKCADTQIGFRTLADGTYEEFHDTQAMAIFVKVCLAYQPEKIQILGDFLDLPSQGRWAQEAGFALTTQKSIDTAYRFLSELRAACPDAQIVVIEGNHDKRMQTFIETNALAAFGLKQASLPGSWPVMSLPHLLRLEEIGVEYVDAYPAATEWDNGTVRNIHGTRSNSSGSTMAQYSSELPHISTWAGHTHRAEIVYRTTIGAYGERVDSYSANPGVLCRIDGTVPGVHSGQHIDGSSARIVENWQQGIGFNYFTPSESIPHVYRIINGKCLIDGSIY